MFKILIIAAIAWIVYNLFKASRFLKSITTVNKSEKDGKNEKLKYDKGDVEDAEFDDIE